MDYGKRIRVVFDGPVYNMNPSELKLKFRLKEDNYNTYIYPTWVSYGDSTSELFLDFADFNQVQNPYSLEYLGEALTGPGAPDNELFVDEFSIVPTLINLNRYGDYEGLSVTPAVDGDVMGVNNYEGFAASYLDLNVAVAGENAEVTFKEGYFAGYLEISSVTVAGTYADADGIPI